MIANVAVDRPEAHWLPSRHRFALSRLIALARLGSTRREMQQPEHLILPIDRDQTAIEMHGVAAWFFVMTTCYVAAALPINVPTATLLAIPLSAIAINIAVVVIGLLLGDGNHIKALSVIMMATMMAVSFYAATTSSWVRFVAWLFFAIVILNNVAAGVLWLLRNTIQAAEERCVR